MKFLASLTLLAALASSASAALVLTATNSSSSTFSFTITGDFSGLTAPSSKAEVLYLVPLTGSSVPSTDWLSPGYVDANVRPSGSIGGSSVAGWVYLSDTSSSSWTLPGADSYAIIFSAPMTTSSVISTSISLNDVGIQTNPSGAQGFALYWGNQQVATHGAVPEPSAALLGLVGATLLVRRRRA